MLTSNEYSTAPVVPILEVEDPAESKYRAKHLSEELVYHPPDILNSTLFLHLEVKTTKPSISASDSHLFLSCIGTSFV
jgi:hypothetical protein